MPAPNFSIDPDIQLASTLPANFYQNPQVFQQVRDRIFARTWHCIGAESDMPDPGQVQPFSLLPHFLNEPLLLTRDQDETLHCLSNVCTHRGMLLRKHSGPCSELRCPYHGRRFSLDGQFLSMPEFKKAKDFPRESDHLPRLPLEQFGPLMFTALDPWYSFDAWIAPLRERIGFLPLAEFHHAPAHSRTYEIEANWALYCDNYLEGFHIPFVHPGLNQVLDYKQYQYECYPWGNLQLGVAKTDELCFELPVAHPDAGKLIGAYYFWLFPNLMLNFYPWGLSLNLVAPISQHRTEVRYETFLWKEEMFQIENQNLLHETELEDGAIVEAVQQGVRSRLYKEGRFSPNMEIAVHQFHQLIASALQGEPSPA